MHKLFMCKLSLFLLYHNLIAKEFSCLSNVVPINLNELEIGNYQTNQLAESRIFFSDIIENSKSEYVGIFSYKYNKKFYKLIRIQNMHRLQLSKKIVWAPYLASEKWIDQSESNHFGIKKYLLELGDINNLEINKKNGIFCNSFLCHIEEYIKFKNFFLSNFFYFYEKYGYKMDFFGGCKNRHANYFYERFATIYFSNASHLTVERLPEKKFFL